MASALPLLPWISRPSPSHSLLLLSLRTLPYQSQSLPSSAGALRFLPIPSLSCVDKSWENPGIWKGPVGFGAGKQHALFSNRWSQQLSENTAFPLQLNCTAHDTLCTSVVFAGSLVWMRLFDILVQKNVLDQKLSRKLVHISTGVLFALTWPLYSNSPWARFFALAIPFANILKLLLYGLGILKDEGLVKSISREGASVELLRGPLYYVLVLCLCTVIFWRDSPAGMIALAIMCGGDGIADIVGSRFGGLKLPYNPRKSWAGSIAMFVFGFVLSIGFLYYYSSLGFYRLNWGNSIKSVAVISSVATLVESLPITSLDDNLSVPLVSILLGVILFPTASL